MVLAIMVIPVVTFAQGTITVTGTVTDDTEQPVIGASVMVKGSLSESLQILMVNIPSMSLQMQYSNSHL